jgi:hypothetical protein
MIAWTLSKLLIIRTERRREMFLGGERFSRAGLGRHSRSGAGGVKLLEEDGEALVELEDCTSAIWACA